MAKMNWARHSVRGVHLLTGLIVVLGALGLHATSAQARLEGPPEPWLWADAADHVAVIADTRDPNAGPRQLDSATVVRGGGEFRNSVGFQEAQDLLLKGEVEAWGEYVPPEELPTAYILFAGENIPDGAQFFPVSSLAGGLRPIPQPDAAAPSLRDWLRQVLLYAVDDPSDMIAVSAGTVLSQSDRQPDPTIEAALSGLSTRDEPMARVLAHCSQALYGDPEALESALRLWGEKDLQAMSHPLYQDVRGCVFRAMKSCSQAGALPVLLRILDAGGTDEGSPDAYGALMYCSMPEAIPSVARQLGADGTPVTRRTLATLARLTLHYGRGTASSDSDAEKESTRRLWREWWGQEAAPLFDRTAPPPEPPSGPGDPTRLVIADSRLQPAELTASSVSEAAVALALAEGILVALDAALPLQAALGPELAAFPETPTVRDVIEMIARAAEGDPHVWEWGAAIGEPPPQWARGPTTPEVTAEEIAGVLERLPEPVADQLRRRRLIPAESLAADDWEIVRAIGRGRLPPDVDGTSLIDLPREDLDVMVDWEIRVDIEREDRDAVSVYFGRGNLSYLPIRAHCHSPVAPREWEPEDFQRSRWYSERLGNRGGPLGVTDHTLPYWQLRFALEAAEGVLVDHARRPLPAGGTIPLPAGPASVADLAQLVANAEGAVDCHVHPDLAAIEVLLVGPAAAATVANVKLAIAETVYGEWRRLDDTLYLGTAVFTPAQRERRAANGSRRWAPRLAQYCREYDPEIFRLWQAYATLGVGGDLGILPLELQQPLRLELRTTPSHQKEYRDGLWEPWNDGSVRGTARLVTELFIVHQDESRSASPAWGAVWVEPGPLEYPLDLFATGAR